MMLLILVTVAFMWFFQIYFMERNYVASNIEKVQDQVQAMLDDLNTENLVSDEQMLFSLSYAAGGKLLLINKDGQLIGLYKQGQAVNLEESDTEILVLEQIVSGEDYSKICAGKTYNRSR